MCIRDSGNLSATSVGAIQRRLLVLEEQGVDRFFGEPALELADLMRTDFSGLGVISVLDATSLMSRPRLYSTFLLWLLAELFENLPEVGDADRPKLVFFFDEAHLLFTDASKAFLEQVEQTVKLIRSKGVGVFFCTQLPTDVPNAVLSQLGARIQHALRAFTPDDQKALTKTVMGAFGDVDLFLFVVEAGSFTLADRAALVPLPPFRAATKNISGRDYPGAPPVREAPWRMVSFGLIVQWPRRGLQVSSIDLADRLDVIQTRRGTRVRFSLVDCGNLYAIVPAATWSLTGSESPLELECAPGFLDEIEEIRESLAERQLQEADATPPATRRAARLKIAIVGSPQQDVSPTDATGARRAIGGPRRLRARCGGRAACRDRGRGGERRGAGLHVGVLEQQPARRLDDEVAGPVEARPLAEALDLAPGDGEVEAPGVLVAVEGAPLHKGGGVDAERAERVGRPGAVSYTHLTLPTSDPV